MDIAISIGIALLAAVMAYLGVHVTLHPPATPRSRLAYKIGFGSCVAATVIMIFWQGLRTSRSQAAMSDKVTGLTGQLTTLRGDLAGEKRQLDETITALKGESERRQKAERDLADTVKRVGESTRTGVAEDVRKSPIKVTVTGPPVPAESPPLQTEDVRIVPVVVRSEHKDAPYAARWTIQANVPITSLRRMIKCNVPIRYLEWRPSSGTVPYEAGALDPIRIFDGDPSKKSVIINLFSPTGPVVTPERSLIVELSSADGQIKIDAVENGPH